MADRTLDSRNGRQEQAAAAPEAAPAPAPKPAASAKPWLPVIITVVSMPLLAYATTRFVLVPQMTKALSQPGVAAAEPSGSNGAAAGWSTASRR